LAYLDNGASAKVLAEIAKIEPAFRVYALNGLSVMRNDLEAEYNLRELLYAECEETRYGAFRALKNRNPLDLAVRGEMLGDRFWYHIIPSQASPMVHMTTHKLPEIVLFGADTVVRQPFILDAGPTIFVNGQNPGSVVVTQFARTGIDERRQVSNRLDDIIRAVVEMGGTYPDVVQMLHQADMSGNLSSQLVMDRLPEPNRIYQRQRGEETMLADDGKTQSFWERAPWHSSQRNTGFWERVNPRNIFAPNPGESSSDYMGPVNRASRD